MLIECLCDFRPKSRLLCSGHGGGGQTMPASTPDSRLTRSLSTSTLFGAPMDDGLVSSVADLGKGHIHPASTIVRNITATPRPHSHVPFQPARLSVVSPILTSMDSLPLLLGRFRLARCFSPSRLHIYAMERTLCSIRVLETSDVHLALSILT